MNLRTLLHAKSDEGSTDDPALGEFLHALDSLFATDTGLLACTRMVFSSTGAVYGHADSKALPETFPCAPINPYGASKWMI